MVETRRRGRGVVGPLLLVAVGAIFLLGNLGFLGLNAWEVLFRLWPVILIGVGLDLLVGRRSPAWSMAVIVVVVVLIAVGVAVVQGSPSMFRPFGYGERQTETVNQPLGGATRADVDINFGAGAVRLAPLSDSDLLIQGTATSLRGHSLAQSFQLSNGTATYSLGSRGEGSFDPIAGGPGGEGGWDLKLNRNVPMTLRVSGGVGQADMDLTQLHVTDLEARLGVGKTSIALPASGQVRASIDGGVGEVNVSIPQGVAGRVQVQSGIGGVNVPDSYQKQGNMYVSPGYDAAQNRIDLTVKGGIGRVSIQ